MDADTVTMEIDDTKTWSGLPAPDGWAIMDSIHNHHNPTERVGHMWIRLRGERISILEDVTVKADGRKWLHVSVGKPNKKMPTYEDLQTARRLFIGEHRECYMVFPTSDRYVNVAHVLHLWACMDAPTGVLPNFEEIVKVNGQELLSV